LSKMIEAGCTVIGGHSIRDDETKFGYSVTGLIKPQNVLKNGGAQAGDRLLLTKSIGTGVISTAIKKGVAKQTWIDAAIASMTGLNKAAGEVIAAIQNRVPRPSAFSAEGGDFDCSVHALTDITGFGLIGHLREMLLASESVSAELHASSIPLLDGALECVRAGHIPGGLTANRDFAECVVGYGEGVSDDMKTILFDPQTAGGLLISVRPEVAHHLTESLHAAGVPAAEIGEIGPQRKPLVSVKK
jgi:selenide, water dikinase